MKVQGEEAARMQAVRTDSFATINDGDLVSADTESGEVVWTDKTGTQRSVRVGPHILRITPRLR